MAHLAPKTLRRIAQITRSLEGLHQTVPMWEPHLSSDGQRDLARALEGVMTDLAEIAADDYDSYDDDEYVGDVEADPESDDEAPTVAGEE